MSNLDKPQQLAQHAFMSAVNAGLNEETSAELGRLLDEQQARIKGRDRRNRVLNLAIVIVLFGGAGSWFISNGDRISALKQAASEIRSASDFRSIVATYQGSLDKIAVRGEQINGAATSLSASTPNGRTRN